MKKPHDVKDLKLAEKGRGRIEWAARSMPVLASIQERFRKQKPLKGVRVSACLHVTSETAHLMSTLQAGGADITLCASNPLSTQDDVAAPLVEEGISTFAIKGEDRKTYFEHIRAALDHRPQMTMDDGCDLVSALHSERRELLKNVIGGTRETTTRGVRLRATERAGTPALPGSRGHDAPSQPMVAKRDRSG